MNPNTKAPRYTPPSQQQPQSSDAGHFNHMGGISYDISDPVHKLRTVAASSFFGEPKYYTETERQTTPSRIKKHSAAANTPRSQAVYSAYFAPYLGTPLLEKDIPGNSATPSQIMETLIDKALESSVERTLQLAVELRQQSHIRTTPQIILVRAANFRGQKGTGAVRLYAPQIISRADEISVCLAYQIAAFGRRPLPNSLKRALRDRLQRATTMELSKYRMESKTVKTLDAVRLVHPRATAALTALCTDTANLSADADENSTWESIVSAAGKNPQATKLDTWTKAVEVMGHMALLRNLRNLKEASVPETLYLKKLVDGVRGGRQLPFRYVQAFKALEGTGVINPRLKDVLEECLEISYENCPQIQGKTMSLCDNSGSAWGAGPSSMSSLKVAEIGNLTGIITAKLSDEGYVGVFGDRLEIQSVGKRDGTLSTLNALSKIGQGIGEGTENGIWLFLNEAINKRQHWDNIFIYSDQQAGHGRLYGINPQAYAQYAVNSGTYIDVAHLVHEYRTQVNPLVNVFSVQIAGYGDNVMPEFYPRTYVLGGWGDGILQFAAHMIKFNAAVEQTQGGKRSMN